MDKIKELTDFYMWMIENNHEHNIRIRVEMKAKKYLDTVNIGQKLPIHDVSGQSEQLAAFIDWLIEKPERFKPNKPSIMLANEFLKSR